LLGIYDVEPGLPPRLRRAARLASWQNGIEPQEISLPLWMGEREKNLFSLLSDSQVGHPIGLIATAGVGVSNRNGVNFGNPVLAGPKAMRKGLPIGFDTKALVGDVNRDECLLFIPETEPTPEQRDPCPSGIVDTVLSVAVLSRITEQARVRQA
jgi:hypothetical protein